MADVQERIENSKSENGKLSWDKACYRLPVVQNSMSTRKKRSADGPDFNLDFDFSDFESKFDENVFNNTEPMYDSDFEPSVDLSQALFCELVSTFDERCFENNILEIWKYDLEKIRRLTQEEIIDGINSANASSLTGMKFDELLGGVVRNESGYIVAAESALIQLFNKINLTAIEGGASSNDVGTGEIVDQDTLLWEKALIEAFQESEINSPDFHNLYFSVARSFGDISGATILGDSRYLAVGTMVVFIYVLVMLGKFDLVENRVYLSLIGILCVAMAIFMSYGLCSLMGVFYGPVHSILPFLLLGIGIDDMFVIIQCWNNLSAEEQEFTLPVRVGTALKHAGVSITVTSITDIAAFAIGATT
ncbi:hypothetical protein QYM36_009366, partial [Artemia franciscana]